MIAKSEPLSAFVQKYEESGLSIGVFPTQRGDRYAIRTIDPDDPKTGLGFLAAFSSNVREADRPANAAERVEASRKLDAMLHDPKESAKYSMCYCIIDADSVAQFPDKYTAEDLGKSFSIISRAGTALSDSYAEVKEEKKTRRVRGE